ncbi:hypothetical protein [Chitinophaga sedimenti]|nr:hypothetical protein [Chitinophaga sedimenti]
MISYWEQQSLLQYDDIILGAALRACPPPSRSKSGIPAAALQ